MRYWVKTTPGGDRQYFITHDALWHVHPPGRPDVVALTEEQYRRHMGTAVWEAKVNAVNTYGADENRFTDTVNPVEVGAFIAAARQATQHRLLRRTLDQPVREINFEDEPEPKKKRKPAGPVLLDLSSIPDAVTSSRPRFKLPYETADEIRMRFESSIVMVKTKPFYVAGIGSPKEIGLFSFLLQDAEENQSFLDYDNPQFDARSPEPGYLAAKHYPTRFFARIPSRVQRQGLTSDTAITKDVSTNTWKASPNTTMLLEGLDARRNRSVTPALLAALQERLITDVFLNNQMALYEKRGLVYAEYRGRTLGRVQDNGHIRLNDTDKGMSFIQREVRRVGLEA